MSVIFLAGPRFNLMENANTVTASPSADSLFPTTNLYDRIPASIFKFGSITASPTITVDMDILSGTGSFETSSGFPVGWTEANTGTGDVTRSTTSGTFSEGASSAQFTTGAGGTAVIYRDITVRSGAVYNGSISLYGAGASAINSRIQNLNTGSYWNGSAWQAGSTNFATRTAASYATTTISNMTIETYAQCRAATTTLRWTIENTTNGTTCYADGVTLFPTHNFMSIHGHNIDPSVTVNLASSQDLGETTPLAAATVLQPSFYVTYTCTERYFIVTFTGTQSTVSGATWLGEMVVGKSLTLATGTRLPMNTGYQTTQIRVPMRWGSQVYSLGQSEQRPIPLSFRATSMANRQEIFDEVYRRSLTGTPCVVVQHNANSHTNVVYGRLATELEHEWEKHDVANFSTTVEELPFPFVTS